jgi:hypothetical protein
VVSIRHGRRLAGLVAAATGVALLTLAAPASALTVTVPTLPAPLPTLPLPTGASLSGGTGGAPIDVSVTGPGSTAIDLQLPGIPALPTGPTSPVTAPVAPSTPVLDPASPAPAATSRSGDSNPAVAAPDNRHSVALPGSHAGAGAAQPVGPESSVPGAKVGASIDARPADSILSRVPSIATRVALWVALAAVVFVLQMLVGSAVRQHRRKPVAVS